MLRLTNCFTEKVFICTFSLNFRMQPTKWVISTCLTGCYRKSGSFSPTISCVILQMSSLHVTSEVVPNGQGVWTRSLPSHSKGNQFVYPQSIFLSQWLFSSSGINCSGPIAHASMKINYFISITPLMAVWLNFISSNLLRVFRFP